MGLLPDEQGGFREHRSCPDQLFALASIITNRKMQGQDTYVAFLDAVNAYGSVWRDGLWWRLRNKGVPARRWLLLRSLYHRTKSRVLTPDGPTPWVEGDVGVRQGCISPFFTPSTSMNWSPFSATASLESP